MRTFAFNGTECKEKTRGRAVTGRIPTLPPIAAWLERGVYAASLFGSPRANRFVNSIQTLKRPEGCAPGTSARMRRAVTGLGQAFAGLNGFFGFFRLKCCRCALAKCEVETMTTLEQIKDGAMRLSKADQKVLPDWLTNVLEDGLALADEFKATIKRGEADFAAGDIRIVRPDSSRNNTAKSFFPMGMPVIPQVLARNQTASRLAPTTNPVN